MNQNAVLNGLGSMEEADSIANRIDGYLVPSDWDQMQAKRKFQNQVIAVAVVCIIACALICFVLWRRQKQTKDKVTPAR